MITQEAIQKAEKMQPSKAIGFFRQQINIPTKQWGEISSQAYATSFAVAGAMEEGLLNGFRKAVKKALENGTTLQEFRKDFDRLVAKHGWDYHGSRAWRSKLIYSTNLAAAYSAGRYKQMTTKAALALYPYWEYVHHNCVHPRQEHLDWSGTVLKNDDPWWQTHYPPNGWGCHCTVRMVSVYEFKARNLKLSEAPPLDSFDWKNPATGAVTKVPKGIDPGFQTNVGMEWQKAEAERAKTALKVEDYSSMPVQERFKKQSSQIQKLMDKDSSGMVSAGTLPKKVQELLGSESDDVLLSKETLQKQNVVHRGELKAEDYEKIPELIADPSYLIRSQKAFHLILVSRSEKQVFKLILKRTGDKKENYLVSFFRLSEEHFQQLIRNNKDLVEKDDA